MLRPNDLRQDCDASAERGDSTGLQGFKLEWRLNEFVFGSSAMVRAFAPQQIRKIRCLRPIGDV
jgi:hypothetical protein